LGKGQTIMPPTDNDGILEPPPINLGDDEMPVDPSNLEVALTAMANSVQQSAQRRVQRADQLAGDSDRMWTVAMTTPTQFAALAQRAVNESGSGRTRAETNGPANTAAPQ